MSNKEAWGQLMSMIDDHRMSATCLRELKGQWVAGVATLEEWIEAETQELRKRKLLLAWRSSDIDQEIFKMMHFVSVAMVTQRPWDASSLDRISHQGDEANPTNGRGTTN